jgi:hypothetical protein
MMRKNRIRDKRGDLGGVGRQGEEEGVVWGGGGGPKKRNKKKFGAESWHVAEKLPAEPLMRSVGYNK